VSRPFIQDLFVVFDVFCEEVSSGGIFRVGGDLKGVDGITQLHQPVRVYMLDDFRDELDILSIMKRDVQVWHNQEGLHQSASVCQFAQV
jgi:hypothetical protein